MSNIQFFHKRMLTEDTKQLISKGGVSLALDLGGLEQHIPNLRAGQEIQIRASVAYCSPKDNFSKVVARRVCTGRLAYRNFTVVDIIPVEDKAISKLIIENGSIKFTILVSPKGLRFVSCD